MRIAIAEDAGFTLVPDASFIKSSAAAFDGIGIPFISRIAAFCVAERVSDLFVRFAVASLRFAIHATAHSEGVIARGKQLDFA